LKFLKIDLNGCSIWPNKFKCEDLKELLEHILELNDLKGLELCVGCSSLDEKSFSYLGKMLSKMNLLSKVNLELYNNNMEP